MLPVRRKPIKMLGTVMDGMEAPQKLHSMLQAMAPVNKEITQDNDFNSLQPPGLRAHGRADYTGNQIIQPCSEEMEDGKHQPAPDEILSEKEGEIRPPVGSQQWLRSGWENLL